MQNKENPIDGLFRDKLNDHKVIPPPSVWKVVEENLDGNKRKKRLFLIWGTSMVASLLLAFLAGWYFSGKFSPNSELQARNAPAATSLPVQNAPAENKTFAGNHPLLQNTIKSSAKIPSSETQQESANSLMAERTNESASASHGNIFLKLMPPLKIILENKQYDTHTLITMNDAEGLSEADRAIIAQNIQNRNLKETTGKKKDSGFAVGVEASPVYRFNNSSSSPADYGNLVTSPTASEYKTSFAGGVVVTYKTSKRLSVQSGVGYDEIAQSGGQIGVTYDGHNWLNDQYTDKNFLAGTNSTSKDQTSNQVVLNTNMGIANITLPEGTEVASPNTINKVSNQETLNYDFSQRNSYIQIPLIFRYKIIDQRLGLHFLGGVNTNVLISNEASLSSKSKVIANGKTEGLNPLTFTSSLGVGMSYAITSHFNFSLEPTMKFQLNSLNSQQYYDSRPYAVGIYTGVTYQF